MKVKEVDRTANIAWSPAPQVPIYLAAGTAAQQLDATFSTSSSLEIYSLNLAESGHDLPCVASLPVDQRFHKVVWGANGMQDEQMPSGLIVGGSDRGVISMYDADKLIKGEKSLVFSDDKHTGPVSALDFNPFQHNLLASGASESEIYIWDVNKATAPMTPGPKSQPMDDVRCISWNRQVQHILASAFSSRCLVWDLRKNDPIIKVSDSTSRMRCKVVAWHPDVATQMALASEDDHTPVIQIWDLRLASSPLKTLEGHSKGVLSLAWCKDDSDLLLSCGKDNRILVWNPNSPQGDIVAELPTSNQWSFDVSFCPRNPAIIASASFDGHISMYSLMGGQQQVQPTNRITDSFGPGMEAIPQPAQKVTMQLKSPPKWLRRPCGASFGFGGKLVSFENLQQTVTNSMGVAQTQYKPQVYMSRVVTEQELVDRSIKLETSLEAGNHEEFCANKVAKLTGLEEERIWQYIRASFSGDPATEYLNLLGLNLEEIKEKLTKLNKPPKLSPEMNGVAADISCLGLGDQTTDEFDTIAANVAENQTVPSALDLGFDLDTSDVTPCGQLSLALLSGNIELAVRLCVEQARWADALILASQAGGEVLKQTQAQYFQQENAGGGTAALVEAVAMDAWERLVNNADLNSWKEVLSAVVVYCDVHRRMKLAGQLAARLAAGGSQYTTASTLAYIVAADMEQVLDLWMKDVSSPQQLQDMVEVVVILRASLQNQGLSTNLSADSKLAANLARYASLLASQGCLTSALTYLGDTSSNTQLQELKERLEKALAPAQAARASQASSVGGRGSARPESRQQQPFQPAPVERKMSSAFNTGLPSQYNPAFNQPNNNQYGSNQPAGGNQYGSNQSASGYNQPASSNQYGSNQPASGNQYGSNQPASGKQYGGAPQFGGVQPPTPAGNYGQSSSAPPPAVPSFMEPAAPAAANQPPPLAAAPPPAGGANPLLKGSRAVDPSITGPPGGGFAGGFNNYNQGYGQQQHQQQQPDYSGQQQQQYNYGAPANSYQQQQQPPANSFGGGQTAYGGQENQLAKPSIFTPELSTPVQAGRMRTLSQSSTGGGSGLPPVGFKHTPDHGGPGHTPVVSSGAGWNDPPALMSRPKPLPPTETSFQSGPITHPMVGTAAEPAAPSAAAPSAWSGFTPAPVYEAAAAAPAPAPAAPEPVPLPPMPEEHKRLQEVLDMLVSRCQQAANHPQTRRKLEDVKNKLEILYRKLREQVLTPVTLQGLHQIVQCISQYDYASCMQVISGLIAGGSFSELADFMPGIKVLLQVAQQSGVYVEQK